MVIGLLQCKLSSTIFSLERYSNTVQKSINKVNLPHSSDNDSGYETEIADFLEGPVASSDSTYLLAITAGSYQHYNVFEDAVEDADGVIYLLSSKRQADC